VLTAKIVIKDDYIRADGTCALMQIFLNGKEKASAAHHQHLPILTKAKSKIKYAYSKDYNLIIEKH
jgi:hypothetical protein